LNDETKYFGKLDVSIHTEEIAKKIGINSAIKHGIVATMINNFKKLQKI
jgi:hypothetical protein